MTVSIIPVYAALIGVLFVALSVRVILLRVRLRVLVGDGGQMELLRAMRVQANCAEYAPIALLLLFFAEVQGAGPGLLHVLGALLLVGRVLHAWGVSQSRENIKPRQIGMVATFSTILIVSGYLLLKASHAFA